MEELGALARVLGESTVHKRSNATVAPFGRREYTILCTALASLVPWAMDGVVPVSVRQAQVRAWTAERSQRPRYALP
jgi:hypothetical protein